MPKSEKILQVLESDTVIDEDIVNRWSNWNVKDGYSEPGTHPVIKHGDNIEEVLKNESLPRRVITAGLHAGLTVVLNVEKDEYYCSGSESVGFKVSSILL